MAKIPFDTMAAVDNLIKGITPAKTTPLPVPGASHSARVKKTLYLSYEQSEKLRRASFELDMEQSEIVRIALDKYFCDEQKRRKHMTMLTKNDVPRVHDPNYIITAKEQTIIIEISIVNSFILNQIHMPMVTDMLGGEGIVECFQRILGACILTFIKEGLICDEFYNEHKILLDVNFGIKKTVKLSTMAVSDLAYDLERMINRYMVTLGHEDEIIPEKDGYYGNELFFTPQP